MKKSLKIAGILLLIVVAFVALGLTYIQTSFPKVEPAADIKLTPTPERLKRGEYLARHVALCLDCHSQRDWSLTAGPVIQGTEGMGGEIFNEGMGVPGTIYARNITPAALSDWSDGELVRAITVGVNKHGEALFPLMPYQAYGELAEEDILSIATYIRSLPAVKSDIPQRSLKFPMNLIVRTIPASAKMVESAPSPSDGVKYGEYMIKAAECIHCHTQMDHGKFLPGMEYAGGVEHQLPGEKWAVRSANITPDPETGIGNWKRDDFIRRFKSMDPAVNPPKPVKAGEFNTTMPWAAYAGMSERDLGAIYDYLMSLKPVRNPVEKFV